MMRKGTQMPDLPQPTPLPATTQAEATAPPPTGSPRPGWLFPSLRVGVVIAACFLAWYAAG